MKKTPLFWCGLLILSCAFQGTVCRANSLLPSETLADTKDYSSSFSSMQIPAAGAQGVRLPPSSVHSATVTATKLSSTTPRFHRNVMEKPYVPGAELTTPKKAALLNNHHPEGHTKGGSRDDMFNYDRFTQTANKNENTRNRKENLEQEYVENIGTRSSDPNKIERCIACLLVWSQVEMDVGHTEMDEVVYQSLERNCMEAQSTQIFWAACQDMLAMSNELVNGYIEGVATSEICLRNQLCKGK